MILSLLSAMTGCAGQRVLNGGKSFDLAWPADDPRIRLQRIIDLRKTVGGGSRFLTWLGGDEQTPRIGRPYAVAWDGPDLLFTDPDLGRLGRIDRKGRITLSAGDDLTHPIGVAACPQGIVVSDSGTGKVALFDRALKRTGWLAEGLSRPTGIACDEERIFLVDTAAHHVVVFDADGSRRHLGQRGAGPGEYNFPSPLTLDHGTLLIGDTLNFRIQRIDPTTGASLHAFGRLGDSPGETPRIKGVGVDAAGRIWISDAILDRVSLYEPDGTLLVSLGGTGADPGRFSFPAGIAAHPDGRVVVADSLNSRLQVFQLVDAPCSGGG